MHFSRHPRIQALLALFIIFLSEIHGQQNFRIELSTQPGLVSSSALINDSTRSPFQARPLYIFDLNNKTFSSADAPVAQADSGYAQVFDNRISVSVKILSQPGNTWNCELLFRNISQDTLSIGNIIPFGRENSSAYITGLGPWDLARAYLFRPGYKPVRVVLPDNAWELGYSSFRTGDGSVCSLARRQKTDGGQKKRYETALPPGSDVKYHIWAESYTGDWQNGLRLMFRDRYLFDLRSFDNTLFEREDLKWIKSSYIIILQMAWDREFFDRTTGKYTYAEELKKWNEIFGNIDVFGIWPTWPRLGLDKRNQWDMYYNMPGGVDQLKAFARMSRLYNTKFFIAYNPWDNSTRKEDHYKGMATLIEKTEADGVVLDTRGSSSYELQSAADSVRKGVVMYSEGMAITKDMPGIIAGRVHNAIYFSPELNLNKLIKPDFAIFRVCDVGEDRNHREIAIAFFNGYGTELNLFRPGGRNEGYRNDLEYLARTTTILRQNNDAFLDKDWTPLIKTTADSIFVNRWKSGNKTIYTVLSMKPGGFSGKLFRSEKKDGYHYVSLWNHKNIEPSGDSAARYISAETDGWNPSLSGTRQEGSVDCIAMFPELLSPELRGDSLKIKRPGPGDIIIWKGAPSKTTFRYVLKSAGDTILQTKSILGYYEGKIVIQYLNNGLLSDEAVVEIKGGNPWLTSRVNKTPKATSVPADMVLVPKSEISCTFSTNEDFVIYPDINKNITLKADSFLIDKYPVTNAQFYEFMLNSGYKPTDTTNFLRHWSNGLYRQGQEMYPVVYISYEDAVAYANWAGKRLPTQAEWQIAAQGTDQRKWPWGNEFHGTFCNNSFDRPTPVDAFSKGASPWGALDMVGNVWQMTNDVYYNGAYYFNIIRGGSFYHPDSSWWYIQGGPQQLDKTQILLMMSQGFDRNETVGFRCVKDIDPGRIKIKK